MVSCQSRSSQPKAELRGLSSRGKVRRPATTTITSRTTKTNNKTTATATSTTRAYRLSSTRMTRTKTRTLNGETSTLRKRQEISSVVRSLMRPNFELTWKHRRKDGAATNAKLLWTRRTSSMQCSRKRRFSPNKSVHARKRN